MGDRYLEKVTGANYFCSWKMYYMVCVGAALYTLIGRLLDQHSFNQVNIFPVAIKADFILPCLEAGKALGFYRFIYLLCKGGGTGSRPVRIFKGK